MEEILEKYDKEIANYASETLPGYNNYLKIKSQPYKKFYDQLLQFYLFSSYLVDSKMFPDDNETESLRVLYARAAVTFNGIIICLSNGLLAESSVLLRSLFENKITVELILQKDSLNRIKLFNDFRYVERYNNLKLNRELLARGVIDEDTLYKTHDKDRIKYIEQKYNDVKNNYHPKIPYQWAWKLFQFKNKRNPSMKDICKELGYEFDYVKIYSPLSISVHSSPLGEYSVTDPEKNAITLVPLFTDLIFIDGCLAIDYFSTVVLKILEFYLDKSKFNELKYYIDTYVGIVIIKN